jgi:hypothetical protein
LLLSKLDFAGTPFVRDHREELLLLLLLLLLSTHIKTFCKRNSKNFSNLFSVDEPRIVNEIGVRRWQESQLASLAGREKLLPQSFPLFSCCCFDGFEDVETCSGRLQIKVFRSSRLNISPEKL